MIQLYSLLTDSSNSGSDSDKKLENIAKNPLQDTLQDITIHDTLQDIDSADLPNLIEIYIKKAGIANAQDDNIIDICIDDKMIELIQYKYKNFKTTKYICYYRNELCYVYDMTDDNQYVYSKLKKIDNTIPTKRREYELYMISYKFSKLPTHLFPCLNDIDDVVEYTLSECKLTNRLSLIIRKDNYGQYVYIEYKHSPQMDIEKIQANINNIINNIFTISSM